MLHARLVINITLLTKTIGHRLGILQHSSVISNAEEHSTESTLILLSCFKVWQLRPFVTSRYIGYTMSEFYTKLRHIIDCINGKSLGYALSRSFRINSPSIASFLLQSLSLCV